jgi:hypothetical protein
MRSSVVERKDGRCLRRFTVYLPVDLGRLLTVHCATQDVDVSSFVADVLRHCLPQGPSEARETSGIGSSERNQKGNEAGSRL